MPVDYIGVRRTVIAPNVAPIGLSKPHVGPICVAGERTRESASVACCNVRDAR